MNNNTEKLRNVISEINATTGKKINEDFAELAALQIIDVLMKSEELKASAKSDTKEDFIFKYFEKSNDSIKKVMNQNTDFFSFLMSNDEIMKESVGTFCSEVYNDLRKERKDEKMKIYLKEENGLMKLMVRLTDADYMKIHSLDSRIANQVYHLHNNLPEAFIEKRSDLLNTISRQNPEIDLKAYNEALEGYLTVCKTYLPLMSEERIQGFASERERFEEALSDLNTKIIKSEELSIRRTTKK